MARPLREPPKQLCRLHTEGAGELDEVFHAYVSFAALDSTYISPMQRSELGQGLLGQALFEPDLADVLADAV